ncbi:sigma-70 family RNA polymerase sigma factor [Cytobacillus sp. FSL M8-0252]
MIQNNERFFLSASVLSLPIKYREVIILYYYDGLSIVEISHILNVNENTLKTRLKRARGKLRVLMEGREVHG